MEHTYGIGSTVFEKWLITRKLGEGSFGTVYEIQREDFGEVYRSALKVITVPQSSTELKTMQQEGMDNNSIHSYFYSVVSDIVREFALMNRLKGFTNIVCYEDHEVIPHDDGMGWDILIRMELLTPVLEYAYSHTLSRREVVKLGIDLCRALELCQKNSIIHRDIKPENIFVSDNGDFKLGDFGIARTIERTMSGLSKKGTYNYMAPEVYRGGDYGFSVDTYSLGIVMYRLLNNNRLPFLPPVPEPITYNAREQALRKRMNGEPMPQPVYGYGRLGDIVRKACSYDPKDRYPSPAMMRRELEAIRYDPEDELPVYPCPEETAVSKAAVSSREAASGGSASSEPAFFAPVPAEDSAEKAAVLSGVDAEQPPAVSVDAPVDNVQAEAEPEETVSVFASGETGPEAVASASDTGADAEEKAKNRHPVGRAAAIIILIVISALAALLVLYLLGFDIWGGYSRDAAGSTQEYDIYGDGNWYHRDEYDASGLLIRQSVYDEDRVLRQYYQYEYDSDGLLTKESWYEPDGKLLWYSVYEYNTDGLLTEQSHYDEAGRLTQQSYYDSNGNTSSYSVYEYDPDGRLAKESDYDSNGNLYYTRIYDAQGTVIDAWQS